MQYKYLSYSLVVSCALKHTLHSILKFGSESSRNGDPE